MNKYIYMTLGDGFAGKTTVARLVAERLRLYKRLRTRLFDADEKKAFSKYHPSVVQTPLRNVIDFVGIEEQFDDDVDFGFLDNPGTARQFIADAIRDAALLADLGIVIRPILVVGDRGSSVDTSLAYMRQVSSVEKIFIINNPKKIITEKQKAEFEELFLDKKAKGPANRVIIHLPPLQPEFATEFEKCELLVDDIVKGNSVADQSTLLSRRATRIDFMQWSKEVFEALKPLLQDMEANLPPSEEEVVQPLNSPPSAEEPRKAVKLGK